MAKKNDDGSPSGMSLGTKPKAVKLNPKVVGVVGLVLLVGLLLMFIGIMGRGKPGEHKADEPKKTTAATDAARQIVADVPKGNAAINAQKKEAADLALLQGRAPAPTLATAPPPLVPAPPGMGGNIQAARPPTLPGNPGVIVTQNGQAPISEAQQRRREAEKKRSDSAEAAIRAPTSAGGGGGGAGLGSLLGAVAGGASGGSPGGLAPPVGGSINPAQALSALGTLRDSLSAGAGGQPAGGGLGGLAGIGGGIGAGVPGYGGRDDDPNGQGKKQGFLAAARAAPETNYIPATRKPGLSPELELKAGWLIPAVLSQALNSDLPGQLSARVTENVYDTATGGSLLIPQGSIVVGVYDSQVAYGQDGLLVVWKRVIFPDASSIDLGGFGGADQAGKAGFRDQVNNHYGRLIGFSVMTSLFSAGYQITQRSNQTSLNGQPSASQTAASAVAQQLSQLGIEVARKNLQIQPTITIRAGYKFNVKVERDIIFPQAYAYGNAQ